MQIKIHRLNRVQGQLVSGNYAYFDLSKYNGKLHESILWILKKIGLVPVRADEYLPSGEIDTEDIVELIYANQGVLESVFHLDSKYLLVGEDMQKALKIKLTLGVTQFPLEYQSPNYSLSKRYAGMYVVFVPYMKGLVVLPDLHSQSAPVIKSGEFVANVPNLESL